MYEYAHVHVVFTIPLALLLTTILWPLFTRRDLYKISFLQLVAVTYTIPWDSYLIKNRIWTYPPHVIVGPVLLDIPAEELFFFVVQTYMTCCLQILLTKSVVPSAYLHNESDLHDPVTKALRRRKHAGQAILVLASVAPIVLPTDHAEGTYMRLILVWAAPVLLMLWSLAYQLLLRLPWTKTWLPIALPTLFLWVVDTLALRRGTWSIELGTKLDIRVWPYLEIEEATFFLLTNILVVWGATAFDNAVAILDTFPGQFPPARPLPSPALLIRALLVPTTQYDQARVNGIRNALVVLARKSRSFHLASAVFDGPLRIDLVLLYGFCRVADDLIDDAPSAEEADAWIRHVSHFLDVAYSSKSNRDDVEQALLPFPSQARSILRFLPADRLPAEPLSSLLDGFRIDQQFLDRAAEDSPPIQTLGHLERYASCVAATVAELCLNLVYQHDLRNQTPGAIKERCLRAGAEMGRALQYINIVRDVDVDAAVGRCYIPSEWWWASARAGGQDGTVELGPHRQKILDMAFALYAENRDAIEDLPGYARGGIRVAVESYIEIGRVIRERLQQGKPLEFAGSGNRGRASVPRSRRVWVGWRTMAGWRGEA